MAIAIIRAEVEDAEEILVLQKKAFQSEAAMYQDFSIPTLIQNLAEMQREFEDKFILKAIDPSQKIVGSVRARMADNECHIGRLIVEPDMQNQGLGSQLMQAIEAAFSTADGYTLETGCKSQGNIAFYKKRGYKIVGEKRISEKVNLVVMRKPGPNRMQPPSSKTMG